MKQYRLLETRWGKCVFAIFLLGMLLLARDTLITTMLLGFYKSQFIMLGLLGLLGLIFLFRNRSSWKELLTDKRLLLALLSGVIVLLPMVIKGDWQMMYFSVLLCLLTAIFLTFFTSYQQVAKYYVVILSGLCVYSLLVSYGLKYLALAGKITAPVLYNASGWEFYNFGLGFAVTWEFWHRNFGIFREPGVYQFFILLALYLNNYAVDWKKNWQVWTVNALLALTMLSTFAVGGVIELGLFAVFLYFDKKMYRNKWGLRIGLFLAIVAVALLVHIGMQIQKPGVEGTVYYVFYDMLIRLTTDSDSLVDRLSAIFTNLQMFLRNPLFGDTIADVLYGTNHNTSSTLILFAVLGISGGILHVASWVALLWKKERPVIGNLILLVIMFMSFNTQNLIADVFFWLFPYMALTQWAAPKLKLPKRKV